MKRLRITRSAFRDMVSIWSYVAADNQDAADRMRENLILEMRKLCDTPGMGHERADVKNPAYRFWRVGSYIVAFHVKGNDLFVSRVIHGAKDFRRLFKSPPRRGRSS